jgi:flagellar biosynthesis protein FlhA
MFDQGLFLVLNQEGTAVDSILAAIGGGRHGTRDGSEEERLAMRPRYFGTVGVPAAVVVIVVMLVVPMPTFLLDVLIVTNITASVLVLLTALRVKDPLDFSVFPTLLLVATMFRLALNVSATRLVLLNGYAGTVIQAFGHFVVGGSLVVGLVVFLILVVIQFVVITNGAGRVAEVAARFTLDAMPGKQMAIDADLNAGLINAEEARRRRAEIAAEADFYGAMDGASKFVKGDAVAALVITAINLLGGLAVGVVERHLAISQAVSTYSLLSVGDGLVSQIPALLLSVSTGIIVTRAASEDGFGSDLLSQFARQAGAVQLGGLFIAFLGLLPGLPRFPFLAVGLGAAALGRRAQRRPNRPEPEPPLEPSSPPADTTADLVAEMRVEPLELELAFDMIDLVDSERGGDLLGRVRALRRQMAAELGLVVPPIRTRDNIDLPSSSYAIRLFEVEVARGSAPAGKVLVMGESASMLPGEDTREPVFGLPARWVSADLRQQALVMGATVVDRSAVIATHLAEVIRREAGRLLSRTQVKELLDVVRASHPVVVEELGAVQLSLGDVQRVLRELLDEQVPIRDLVRILEAITERARVAKDSESLVEAARQALGPALAARWADGDTLSVVTLDPLLEQRLVESLRTDVEGSVLSLGPDEQEALVSGLSAELARLAETGCQPVVVCSARLRPALRRLLRGVFPRLGVLSVSELQGPIRPKRVGVVRVAEAAVV